jgi:hypothetical protein
VIGFEEVLVRVKRSSMAATANPLSQGVSRAQLGYQFFQANYILQRLSTLEQSDRRTDRTGAQKDDTRPPARVRSCMRLVVRAGSADDG